jgi:hypothetical protein
MTQSSTTEPAKTAEELRLDEAREMKGKITSIAVASLAAERTDTAQFCST